MAILAEQQCSVCQAGGSPLSAEEIDAYLRDVPNWLLLEEDGIRKLRRTYRFGDYAAALAFTQKVGAAAQNAGHHPAILTEWARVTVSWWTHKIGGLHENDFIMAARTDQIYREGK